MDDIYDIAIVGGGPAGCAAAITAARSGATVLLVEQGKYPRHKVCGEFVSSEALTILKNLLGEDLPMKNEVRVGQARLFIDNEVIKYPIDPSARSISRFQMDAELWSAAIRAGADCKQGMTVSRVERNSSFSIETTNHTYAAGSVIIAAGRWSNFSHRTEARPLEQARLIGVKAHFMESEPHPSVDLYFFRGGYCGVQPVSGSEVNVSAMVHPEVGTTIPRIANAHRSLHDRSLQWTRSTEVVTTSPLIFRIPQPVRDQMLMAGDAAGFIDPFVGDGISIALHSGKMAAESLLEVVHKKKTMEEAARDYSHFYQRRLLPAFNNAARVRALLTAPIIVRKAALRLMRLPTVAKFMVRQTRVRST